MRPTARPFWASPGSNPASYDAEKAEAALATIAETQTITVPGLPPLAFDPKKDLSFDFGPALPGHANGMILKATDAQGDVILQETLLLHRWWLCADRRRTGRCRGRQGAAKADVPYPFETADEMLAMAKSSGLTIAQMKLVNELKFRTVAPRSTKVLPDCGR